MPLKKRIKYQRILFELSCRRLARRSILCLRLLKPIFWLLVSWVVFIILVCFFEKNSFCSVLAEAKCSIFTSVVLAAVSVLTTKIPQYKMYLKRRYSLRYDVSMTMYSLEKIFEKEELDIVEISKQIDNMKEIHQKIKQLRSESEAFITEKERKEFKWVAERFFSTLVLFETNVLFEKEGQDEMLSVLTDLDEYLNFPWTRDMERQRKILRIIKDYCYEWDQSAEFSIFADEEEFKTN